MSDDEKRKKLLSGLSKIVADDLHKPVQYVMVSIEQADMALGRDSSPAAFIDLRSIGGLSKDTNAAISGHACELLGNELGIFPERVFINFADIAGVNWGLNGGVFGG